MKNIKNIAGLLSLLFVATMLGSCKNTDPSVIKIYVRSASNDLVSGAKVVLIGDLNSTPATNEFTDTIVTNSSGFAYFNMESHFEDGGKDYEVGYFDIIATSTTLTTTGRIRAREHTTAVETVRLP